MIKFAGSKIHKKQNISLWLISEQKSIDIVRSVQETASGAYITYKHCVVYVRGSAGSYWLGNY